MGQKDMTTYFAPPPDYLALKLQNRKAFKKITEAESEDAMIAAIRECKINGTNDRAIKLFQSEWYKMHAMTASESSMISVPLTLAIPNDWQYSFEMCHMLCVAILFTIRLNKTQSHDIDFEEVEVRVRNIAEDCFLKKSLRKPDEIYVELINLQIRLHVCLSREKTFLDRYEREVS